jgi:hypothetical protein
MKKFFLLVPIVLLIAVAVTGFGFMKTDSKASASDAKLHVIEHAVANKQITVGTATDFRGNYVVFYNPAFDAADKNQVGNVSGTCLNTSNTVEECHFTLILPKGQITVEGPFISGNTTATFAITGGTGIYDEIKGEVVQTTVKTATGTEFDLVFDVD